MGRPPCCDKTNVKKGPWTEEEDAKLLAYVAKHGIGNWTLVPQKAGLNRCGKSCRLRWTNYLRTDLKHDPFTPQEEEHILDLHKAVGSRWSFIARQLPGRTDNDVKNHWNTKLSKKLSKMNVDPITHKPFSQIFSDLENITGHPNSRNQGPYYQNLNFININNPPITILKNGTLQIQNQFPNTLNLSDPIQNSSIGNMGQFQIPKFESSSSSSSYSCHQTPQVSSSFVWTDFLLNKDSETDQVQNGTEQSDLQGSGSNFISGSENNKSCEIKSSSSSSSGDLDNYMEVMLNRDTEMQMEFPLPLDAYFDY